MREAKIETPVAYIVNLLSNFAICLSGCFFVRNTDNVLVSCLLLSFVFYCSQLAVIALASLCDNVMYFWRKYISDRYLYRRP